MYDKKVSLNNGDIVLGLRGRKWHMQIKIGSKYVRETTRTNDIEQAKFVAYARYDELRVQYRDTGTVPTSTPRVSDLYKRYTQWLKDEYNDKKYRQYDGIFQKYFLFKFGAMRIEEVTEHVLNDWIVWRRTVLTPKGTAPTSSTVHNDLVVLKNFYKWCVQEGVMKRKAIPEFPKFRVESARRPAFVNGADKRLLFEANRNISIATHPTVRSKREDLYTYIVMMLNCGARSGELASIGAKHLEKIKVKQKGRMRDAYSVQILFKTKTISGKRSHKRTAVLMPAATKVIDAHIKKYAKKGVDLTDRFFPLHTSFENGFDNLLERCGMKRDSVSGLSYSIYSLRHTYITHRLLAGVTSDIIASQCGTSVKMIEEHYSSVVPLLAKNKVVALDEETDEYKTLDTNFNQLFEEV